MTAPCRLVDGVESEMEGSAPLCVQLARDVEMLLAKRTQQDRLIVDLRAQIAARASVSS